MLFMALGLQQISHDVVSRLVAFSAALQRLSTVVPSALLPNQRAWSSERDLFWSLFRQIYVNILRSFWLPIARKLQSKFQVISVAGYPRDQDHVREVAAPLG